MRKWLGALFLVGLAHSVWAFDHTYVKWNATLATFQDSKGLVRYQKLKEASDSPLKAFLQEIKGISEKDFAQWSPAQQKAFLINAYNALTLQLIVDHYPVKSIKKIGGLFSKPWSLEFFSLLDGKVKSLDPIEHQWLRPKFKDFRIHAAVNCASISCPPLRHEAFVAERLEQQLDEQMTLWLKDSERNSFNGKEWQISKIFDWYKEDFENWGGGVKAVVRKYASIKPGVSDADVVIKYLPYNWDLNEAQ